MTDAIYDEYDDDVGGGRQGALSNTQLAGYIWRHTIRSADRILVFDPGRVVEEGRHGERVGAGGARARRHGVTEGAA